MRFYLPGLMLATLLLGGCTKVPPMASSPAENPANALAQAGPAIPRSDFINVTDASAQIAPPQVTAGKNLPMAGTTTAPTKPAAGGIGNASSMKNMNMSGNSSMGTTTKRATSGTVHARSKK